MTPDEEQVRALRREAIRRHHPDVGGDPAALREALAALARQSDEGERAPVVLVRRRRLSATGADRILTRLRTALPRRVRGSRRYAEL